MFRDVYKQVMDDIKPRDGLLDEILKKSKSKPKRNFKMLTSYAASIAAVVVIAIAAVLYPDISELHSAQRANDEDYITNIQNNAEFGIEENSKTERAKSQAPENNINGARIVEDKYFAGAESREYSNEEKAMMDTTDLPEVTNGEVYLARSSTEQGNDNNTIKSADEAILIAKNEINASYDSVDAVYDEEKHIWCVCFYMENEKIFVYLTDAGEIIKR